MTNRGFQVDSLFHRYTTSALFDSTKTKILHILQHR